MRRAKRDKAVTKYYDYGQLSGTIQSLRTLLWINYLHLKKSLITTMLVIFTEGNYKMTSSGMTCIPTENRLVGLPACRCTGAWVG